MCFYCAAIARVEDTTSLLPHTVPCGADTQVIETCVLKARHSHVSVTCLQHALQSLQSSLPHTAELYGVNRITVPSARGYRI